ncbi:thioesterase family protein [Reinekea marina]|uniref:Thioesterase family protein n=1 Tax=Reinekea marina TaxID=1310421 RepID=A0ABV7WTQ4_9GAMM|nr:thioesterase family protein [Reinekea marina]MBU2862546.1 thioesterase family protein [Reinekea forsetii]MDN3648765.1 thioesterase family protein [Reinekea marina]
MNLYGRLFLFSLKSIITKPKFDPLATVETNFRVWPHDMDVNIHLTAARYFSFGDLGRMGWLRNNGFLWRFFKGGYRAVLNAQELTYIREFTPFSKVKLEVELMSWDEKYGYFEQRFYSKGKLFAVGHARMAILQKGKVLPYDAVFESFGQQCQSPSETEAIRDWKETLAAKKAHFS